MKIIKGYITIGNRKGVHGRVATGLAEIASTYDVELLLTHKKETADCSSILDVLSMALVYGSFVRVTVRGDRAVEAMTAVYPTLIFDDNQK